MVEVPVEGHEFMLAEFEGTIGDELLISHEMDPCIAWSQEEHHG